MVKLQVFYVAQFFISTSLSQMYTYTSIKQK